MQRTTGCLPKDHIGQLQNKIRQVHEGILSRQQPPRNFFDIHDAHKKKLRKFRHDLHVGRKIQIKPAQIENKKLKLDVDASKMEPPVVVNYVDKSGILLATVYHDGSDYYIQSNAKDRFRHIEVNFTGAAAQSLYFDQDDTTLSLTGDLTLADTMFVNAAKFQTGKNTHITAKSVAIKGEEAAIDGSFQAESAFIMAKNFVNKGELQADARLEISASEITNNGKINAPREYITHCSNYHNKGQVQAGSVYLVNCSGDYDNDGQINADGYSHVTAKKIKLNGQAYFNKGYLEAGEIQTDRKAKVESGEFLYMQANGQILCKGSVSRRKMKDEAEQKNADLPAILLDSPTVTMDRTGKLNNEAGEILIQSKNDLVINSSMNARHIWVEGNQNIYTKSCAHIQAAKMTCSGNDIQLNNQFEDVGSSRVDLQACKLEYSIVSPK